MNDIIDIVIAIALLYFGYKILIWLWKRVVVPTGKKLWKATIILTTIIFFMVLFVLRDAIFDALPKGLQVVFLLGFGAYFGVKYLKAKNRL